MGFYEFKERDAYDFANSLGIETRIRDNELQFKKCPYCGGGNHDDWTFAINLKKNGAFNCFRSTCGIQGNMITLSKDFDFSLGSQVDEYYRPKQRYKTFTHKVQIIPKEPALAFLQSRGISERVAKKYEITTQTNNDNVLVFPFLDENGIMCFIKYRKTDFDPEKDKAKEWCEKGGKPILFGMYQCEDFETLVVTEGQMDSLACAEAGFANVVSVPTGARGFTFFPHVWDWLNKFKKIVIFGDHEKGTITLLDEFSKRLKMKVFHVAEENYKDCKDANDILLKYGKDQVRKCVKECVAPPVDNVIDLADVEDVDPFALEKIPTGLSELDKLLCGGLVFGVVNLITGKAGKGKSTFATQILTHALDKGYSVFAYSGEMPNFLVKSCVDMQIAGAKNIIEIEGVDYTRYSIRKSVKEIFTEWYRGRFFLYDRSMMANEEQDLLKTIELMIVSKNVRVILLDNLMTLANKIKHKGENKYDMQSSITNALEDMARFYNVCIILVAHKRKDSGLSDTEMNDSISGDSDIVNTAGIVIHYDVNTQEENIDKYPRIVAVTKNRVFGRTNYRGWLVRFCEKSKRIYGDQDDVNYSLGWDNSDGFEEGESPFH